MRLNGTIKPDTLAAGLDSECYWFPVRKSGDDGHEFILFNEWGVDAEDAARKGKATDKACGPGYGTTNPVVRIARLRIIVCEVPLGLMS